MNNKIFIFNVIFLIFIIIINSNTIFNHLIGKIVDFKLTYINSNSVITYDINHSYFDENFSITILIIIYI